MIDVSKITYDLIVVTPSGQQLSLAAFLRDLSWEEQESQLAVRLQAEIQNAELPSGWLHQQVPLGAQLYLYADWGAGRTEVFRGTVYITGYNTDPLGHFTVTAYDILGQLLKSKAEKYYPDGVLATTMIKDIANEWKIPLGTISGPNVTFTKKVFRTTSISGILNDILDTARLQGAGKYFIQASEGKINVIQPGSNSSVYRFEGVNITSIQDQQSIENLVTRVKVVGAEKNKRRPVIAQIDGKTEWGIMQDIVYSDQYDTPKAATDAANEILKLQGVPQYTRPVVTVDIPFLRRGDKVHISAGTLDGDYIVTSVTHNATNRSMTVEVNQNA